MQLHEQLEAVTDEATFLEFVRRLAADRRANAVAWENGSIEDFLEASSSWAEDSEFGSRQGFQPHRHGRSSPYSFTAGRYMNSHAVSLTADGQNRPLIF